MNSLKTLPLDIDSFTKVQTSSQYLYVDKTRQIANMIEGEATQVFLARPRRFGKTLLVSTLEALWKGNRNVFEGTWIHKNWDWNDLSYPVLRINMALRGRHEADLVHGALRRRLRLLAGQRATTLFDLDMFADEMLTVLLMDMANRSGREVVVLIDEYDTPITENLDRPDTIGSILDVLRTFYGALKDSVELTRFVFVTGITRFARVGLFSGANHLHDLSYYVDTSDLVGFSQEELDDPDDSGLGPLITRCASHLGWDANSLYDMLEAHYHGYVFAKGGTPVYNPFSLAKCLYDLGTPERVLSLPGGHLPNYWAESGSSGLLLRLLESGDYAPDTSEHDHPDTVERITYDVTRPHLAALLYQTGYLTRVNGAVQRNGQEEWTLDFPNLEVEQTFKEVLVSWRRRQLRQNVTSGPASSDLAHAMYEALSRHAVADIHATFNTYLSASHHYLHPPPQPGSPAPNRGAWKNVLDYEVHYQALLYAACALMGLQVYGELPTVAGRIDLATVFNNSVVIVEIKANQSAEVAVRQALTDNYPAHFAASGYPVVVLGMNINTHTRSLTECVKWELGYYHSRKGQWQHEPFAIPLLQLAELSALERQSLTLNEGLASSV